MRHMRGLLPEFRQTFYKNFQPGAREHARSPDVDGDMEQARSSESKMYWQRSSDNGS